MKTSLLLISSAIVLWSCEPNKTKNSFQTGLYILNEGAFMGGTATLTHWSDQDSITPDAFFAANTRNLGNLGNGLRADGNRIYAVISGAAALEVMEYPDLVSIGRATGFSSPRHALVLQGGDIAVSDWGRNRVYRVSKSSLTISDSVDVATGPEALLAYEDELWVSCSGGYGIDSSLAIIDASTFELLATVPVGINPTSMVRMGNSIYVLCSGYTDYSGAGGDRAASLVRIDATTRAVTANYPAVGIADRPTRLQSDGQVLYWIRDGYTGDVMRMEPTALDYPAFPWIGGGAYGLYVDPATRDVYVLDAKDFQQNGEVRRYSLAGQLISSAEAGVVPTTAVWMP
jgi:DNA-binding beta-propeller fold protein YncE